MNKQPSTIPDRQSEEWLEIGKIVAPQGIKGEVRVYPSTDFPERFEEPGTRWLLHPGDAEPQPVELLEGRYMEGKGLYVVKLAGVDDRDRADELRGCLLLVPESDRLPLEEDEFHVRDLIGLEVVNQLNGELVGTVVDMLSAGQDLLVVTLDSPSAIHPEETTPETGKKKKKSQVLIPFVREIVPVVDLNAGRLEINPPEGLLNINT